VGERERQNENEREREVAPLKLFFYGTN